MHECFENKVLVQTFKSSIKLLHVEWVDKQCK